MDSPKTDSDPALDRRDGSALIAEVRAIITDQIHRHVAMQDTHRAWLAKDIADRVCGLIAPSEAKRVLRVWELCQKAGKISGGWPVVVVVKQDGRDVAYPVDAAGWERDAFAIRLAGDPELLEPNPKLPDAQRSG